MEKLERENQRLKNKQDAFEEIQKGEYTYDHNGNIIIVKKPNLQKAATNQQYLLDYSVHT